MFIHNYDIRQTILKASVCVCVCVCVCEVDLGKKSLEEL